MEEENRSRKEDEERGAQRGRLEADAKMNQPMMNQPRCRRKLEFSSTESTGSLSPQSGNHDTEIVGQQRLVDDRSFQHLHWLAVNFYQQHSAHLVPALGSLPSEQRHSAPLMPAPCSPPAEPTSPLETRCSGTAYAENRGGSRDETGSSDSVCAEYRGGLWDEAISSRIIVRSPEPCPVPCYKRHTHFMPTPCLPPNHGQQQDPQKQED